jgi:cytidylate kinase
MDNGKLVVEEFVEAQVKTWKNGISKEEKKTGVRLPVITVCMGPGSGESIVAQEIAKQLDFNFFHRDIINEIAKSSHISSQVIETLEKERLSGINDFISSLINDKYLWPGLYLEHLMKIVHVIGKHGRAVIVGRGSNFILPLQERFSVRIVAPLEVRIQNVAREYGVSENDAKRRILRRESRRRAFVRQSFHEDIADPLNYDLILNTEKLSIKSAVNAVIGALEGTEVN